MSNRSGSSGFAKSVGFLGTIENCLRRLLWGRQIVGDRVVTVFVRVRDLLSILFEFANFRILVWEGGGSPGGGPKGI